MFWDLWKRKHSVEHLSIALNKIVKVFQKENIEYALAYGTLLGIYRDGHPIEGDDDIDLFIPQKDWDRAIGVMNKHFFQIPQPILSPYFRGFSVNNVQVELYQAMFYKDRIIDCWEKDVHKKKDLYPFRSYGDYLVPRDVETFLVHVYGKDWRIPKSGKDYPQHEKELADFVCTKVFIKKPCLGWSGVALIILFSIILITVITCINIRK
jgi:hypothetical protein